MRIEWEPNFPVQVGVQGSVIKDFDESLWDSTVDDVTVDRDKEMTAAFRDGTETEA